MTLHEATERYLPPLEAALRAILARTTEDFKPFYGMLQYHQGWVDESLQPATADTGKRVRPILCLLVCEACGTRFERAMSLAAALELLHGFSLVHDDIQDRSPTRRHRRTVWSLWGEAQAINVGDALLAAAHSALYRQAQASGPDTALRLATALDETCMRLCEGQFLDMDFEKRPVVTVEQYLGMIERKTAALLAYSTWSGAVAGGAADVRAERFEQMGRELGLAFQVQDDLLGVWGVEADTGKSASSDIASAKKTLPYLYALATLPRARAVELAALYAQPARGEAEVERARQLLDLSQAQAMCTDQANRHHERALRRLEEAQPAAAAAGALLELLARLSGRRH